MFGPGRRYDRRYLREFAAASFFVLAVAVGLYVYFANPTSFDQVLTITGGSSGGLRSQIARRLSVEAGKQGLRLRVVESEGSKQALDRVERGLLDIALVQGGIDPAPHPHIRQLAALHIEPLHLLVKPELARPVRAQLAALRGKTVNLSTPGSGTHDLALEVLRFAGLRPAAGDGPGDVRVSTAGYRELEAQIDRGVLPDAVFTVSDLPSPIVRHLVARKLYQLIPLPFGEAFALDSFGESGGTEDADAKRKREEVARFRIYPTLIPAFTYGVEPPTPSEALPTFGPRLLLVARESVPARAVRRVLEAIFSSEFAQYYRPPLDPSLLELAPEYPWHAGTEEYREYHKPMLAGEVVDLLEKATSLAGAVAGAVFFLWQWMRQYYRRKRELGFESYMVKVAAIEQKALDLELGAMLDLRELLRLQVDLSRLKNEALSRFAEGNLEGEALISGFVAHVNDARNYLTRLILHERDNLENRAQSENRPAEELWEEAVGEWPAEIRSDASASGPSVATGPALGPPA
jgi:TRAP-type uncharacterized transport system substrate-binding protein